jgi:hypothetical protein
MRLLCLVGHSPPALWSAAIGPGGLTDRHRLVPNSTLGETAW